MSSCELDDEGKYPICEDRNKMTLLIKIGNGHRDLWRCGSVNGVRDEASRRTMQTSRCACVEGVVEPSKAAKKSLLSQNTTTRKFGENVRPVGSNAIKKIRFIVQVCH